MLTKRSVELIFSALRALRQSTLCDPYLRRNSIESKPLPSDDTKIAELIRFLVHRSDIAVDCCCCCGSSCQ